MGTWGYQQAAAFRIRQELVVLHGRLERGAQGGDAVAGHAGRQGERPAHDLPAEDQLEGLLGLFVLGVFEHRRHVGIIGMALVGLLHHHHDLLVAQPVGFGVADR
jgi:hypothetical protein